MKYGITLLMLCLLAGCAQRNTQLPPVSGNPEPVNSPAIIQELTPHVGTYRQSPERLALV